MGKALATVGTAIVIGGLALATAGAALIPLAAGGGLAGALGTAAFGVTAGQFITAGLALNVVGSSLAGASGSTQGRDPTEWNASTDNPIPFAFGRIGVAGMINHRAAYGPDNRYQSIVSTLSGAGPIKSFVSYASQDIVTSFNPSTGIATSGDHSGAMWLQRKIGAQPQTALTSPSGLAGGATIPDWGSAYNMNGRACSMLTMYENSKFSEFQGGVEKALHVIEGKFGWDPRLDSTWPGGSGSCRIDDPLTWVWIDEGNMAGLNWSIGMWEGDSGGGDYGVPYACSQVGGIGASLAGIDVAAFVYAANVADANDWKVAAWPDTSMDESVVLDQFLQAGGSWRARVAGKISCVSRGAPQSSLLTVTARDTAGDIEIAFAPSRRDRKNTATGYFLSEEHGWEQTPIDPVTNAAWVTEDRGKRAKRYDIPYCPDETQAAQLTYLEIADAREPISGTVPFKPYMRRIKPGDCFTFSEPGFQLDGLKVRALRRTFDPSTGVVKISWRQETDAKYTDAGVVTGTTAPPVTPGTPPPVYTSARIPIRRTSHDGATAVPFATASTVGAASTSIDVLEHKAWFSDSAPEEFEAETISGLTAFTSYAVFGRDGDDYVAIPSPADAYFSDPAWVFIGWQYTADGGGSYPTPPTAPPGSGGSSTIDPLP